MCLKKQKMKMYVINHISLSTIYRYICLFIYTLRDDEKFYFYRTNYFLSKWSTMKLSRHICQLVRWRWGMGPMLSSRAWSGNSSNNRPNKIAAGRIIIYTIRFTDIAEYPRIGYTTSSTVCSNRSAIPSKSMLVVPVREWELKASN